MIEEFLCVEIRYGQLEYSDKLINQMSCDNFWFFLVVYVVVKFEVS